MNIARRTEIVYNMVSLEPPKSLGKQLRRLKHFMNKPLFIKYFIKHKCFNISYISTGVYPFLLVVSFMHILLKILDWWIPRSVSNIIDI